MTDVHGRQGPETRTRILDAAEALFAENGLDATSMRMITGRAGVNLAAVNYHFGGKDGLIQEVFRRRLTELNRRRLVALEALQRAADGAPLRPSSIVKAFFGTALEMAADMDGGGARFLQLMGRTYTGPNEFVRNFLAEEYAECVDRFLTELYRALPDVPREEILWRFHFMMGATSYAIGGADALQLFTGEFDDRDPARLEPRLMSFLLGGLRGALPDGGGQATQARRSAA
ncbi:MAG: TetR family transcriptional regulator [Rhodocyclaceae bacterium]|nr:TetR family transcriptional regulator [Rhodocyclaceae bacterium]